MNRMGFVRGAFRNSAALRRTGIAGLILACSAPGLGGCGAADTPDEEAVGEVQNAVLGAVEFGVNTPTVHLNQGGPQHVVAMRQAHDFFAMQQVVHYQRGVAAEGSHAPWRTEAPTSAVQTGERPFRWWEGTAIGSFSTLYRSLNNGRILDTVTSTGPDVFPSYSGEITGPVSALFLANHDHAAFGRAGNKIRQSYMPLNDSTPNWADFELSTGPHAPTTSPQVMKFDASSDTLFFGCGAASPARVCEYRVGGPNAGLIANHTFSPASSSFVANTRPNVLVSNGLRYRFAITADLSGYKKVLVIRDSGGSVIEQEIEKSTTARYSTPMPYVRSDNAIAVVYHRTQSNITKVMESTLNIVGQWDTPVVRFDTGVNIPEGNEPVPYVSQPLGSSSPVRQNAILYRVPAGSTVKDTVELLHAGSNKYIKTLLPPSFDESNLYIMQTPNFLYRTNEATGQWAQLGGTVWADTRAWASDRTGLGYAIQGDKLWEVTLSDGTRRQLGTNTWAGPAFAAYGYGTGHVPSLWVIEGSSLYKVDLATGNRGTALSTTFTGVTGMTYLEGYLWVVKDNSLYRVNRDTGALGSPVGIANDWPGTTAMASIPNTDGAGSWLFIAAGSPNSKRVWRVSPIDGSYTKWTSVVTSPTSMSTLGGKFYFTSNSRLYSGNVSTMAITQLPGGAAWGGTVYMAGRNWDI